MKRKIRISMLLVPEGKLRDAMELYPGKTREEVRELLCKEVKKKLFPGLAAAGFFLAMAVLSEQTPESEGFLRPSPGKEPLSVQVQVDLETGPAEFPVSIGALEYTEDRIEELHREAEQYLSEAVPGENESLEKVTEALVFPAALPGEGRHILPCPQCGYRQQFPLLHRTAYQFGCSLRSPSFGTSAANPHLQAPAWRWHSPAPSEARVHPPSASGTGPCHGGGDL